MRCLLFACFIMILAAAYASAAELSKEQRDIVDTLGYPGTFTIILINEDGDPRVFHRLESWDYYRYDTSFTFYDGRLQNREKLDVLQDLALMAIQYRPEQFDRSLRLEQLDRLLPDPTDYRCAELPEALGPGLMIVGAEQLMMGFRNGELVYVETMPLVIDRGGGR